MLTTHKMLTTTTTTTVQDTIRDTFRVDHQTRSGTRKVVTEQFDKESLGDRVVSRDVIHDHAFKKRRN